MADSRRYGLTPQLDIEQILEEAQSRWLRPAEICEILRNYTKFRIAPEPPNKPRSGSLFLFDRKVLRYFRKDGHNWRKKKDGKTVKEAHERLKSGSVDVLHCYYAHGEENENFQRRSYWMLEEDLMHIVLVHYREVKGGKSSSNRARNVDDVTQVSNMNSPDCSNSNSFTNQSQLISQVTDAGSPNSAHTSEYEDAESADNYQKSSRYNPNIEMQQHDDGSLMDAHLANRYSAVPYVNSQYDFQELQAEVPNFPAVQGDITKVFDETGLGLNFSGTKIQIDLTPWEEILRHSTAGFEAPIFQSSVSYTQSVTSDIASQADPFLNEGLYTYDADAKQYNVTTGHNNPAWQISNDSTEPLVTSNISSGSDPLVEGGCNSEVLVKQQSLDLPHAEGLKKYDSFSRWMSKELEEVDHTHITTSSGTYWGDDIGNGVIEDPSMSNHEHLDTYIMSPSLSQDQLFSIVDFSPCWTFSGLEAKVLVTGTFLKNKEDVEKCKWSCMFGEIEVPAEVIGDGILRCRAPALKSGRVPFYVTCSNRLACSEVREFEYRESDSQHMETSDSSYNNVNEMLLHIRLDKLLSLGPNDRLKQNSDKLKEKIQLYNKINSIMKEEDNWSSLVGHEEENLPPDNAEDKLLEALLREKLHTWLLQKVTEDGKGPNIWDEDGQGVLHLAAALGYHWAIRPAIAAGTNINFRDVHGWTALHWAAYCGREHTVVTLITMDAAPGLLTDPTPEYPSGRTPADLASANGHKGIAGFLAESFLTNHLETLTLKDSSSDTTEFSTLPRFQSTEQGILQVADEDSPAGLALKDSLSAVRNASQAAARIYQVFRVHSFHRKKLVDCENDKSGMSDERALSLLSVKSLKTGQHDMPFHAAAIRIQNKYRGWKGRKDFLIIRQRIVKIQAHVRGHQVRKHLPKIVWSVGIVEKVILRWRRKGCGLRGFRSEGLLEGNKLQNQPSKEDDYDFLQEGRKQTEVRLQKALDRVKSMVQYPEARDQYRRLLAVVTELQESKAMQENSMNALDAGDSDVMIELEEFYEDDTFMANVLD